MNNEQLLNDFVDGTLDYQGEATLFAELHLNERLRGDFKTLLLMQRGVRHDMAAYLPPASSTNELFRRLGFAAEGDPAGVAIGGTRGWFGRLLHGLAGGMVGALLMLGLVIWQPDILSVGGSGATSGNAAAAGAHDAATPPAATAREAVKSVHGFAGDTISTSATELSIKRDTRGAMKKMIGSEAETRNERHARRNDARRAITDAPVTPEPETEQHFTPTIDVSPVELISPESTPATTPDRQPVPSATAHGGIDGSLLPDPWESSSLTDKIPLSMEIRALESRSFARIPGALNQESSTLLRNMAIGVRYDLDETQGIGIEFGQEMFYQKFIAEEPNGDLVQHEQNPLLPWAGVTYRWHIYRSSGLNPYIQGLLGATQVGPMVRAMAGAHYEIFPELHLSGGVEVSGVGYRMGDADYSSWKYGVTYGMSVNF